MNIPRSALIAGSIVVMGVLAVIAANRFIAYERDDQAPTPVVSQDSAYFDRIPNQNLIPSRPPRERITGPGVCELSDGKIVFISPTTARHEKATLSYRNIDDPARLIFWRVQPNDGLVRVGPNIFSGLPLPSGSTSLTVTFNEGNRASRYTLTASVSYGIYGEKDNAVLGIATALCKGKITVESNY